ncbi:MAG TPA: cytochrome c [Myxococcales bacterium]
MIDPRFVPITGIAKLVCGAVLATSLAAAAEEGGELRRLAALVDYLAADYPGAVKAGAIIAESEYEEQRGVIADVRRIAHGVAPRPGEPLVSEVDRLEKDFLAKADSRSIVRDAVDIHRRLVEQYGLVLTPLVPPDLTRAGALYQTACAACHGKRGRADTVQARALTPRPASFLDAARLSRISPALAFNAVTLGVANTAMPSFDSLPVSDRWSLAFYVVSLRHSRAQAKRGAALVQRFGLPVTASLSRLSGLSDLDLDGLLRATQPSPAARAAIVAYLRQTATFEAGAGSTFAEARRLLSEVARAAGEPKTHDLAVAAYIDGIEPHESVLKDRDATAAARLEHAFAELRRLVDGGAAASAVRDQVGRALLLLDQVEEGALAAGRNRPRLSGRHTQVAEAASTPASLSETGCGEGQPGFSPGPVLRKTPGMVEFAIFKDCIWPGGKGLAIAVSLVRPPPSRERVAALILDLYRQAKGALGKRWPEAVQICAFAPETTRWSADYLACAKEGFEPPGEEPDELGPELDNRTPFSLAEEAEKLLQDRAAAFPGGHRMRLRVDQRKGEISVTYPYLEPGQDAFARQLTLAAALQPFLSLAGDFYTSSVPEPRRLSFAGVWNGKTVLRVRLDGERDFRALDQWPMIERLHQQGIPDDARLRTPEQQAKVRDEYQRALSRLPPGRAKVSAPLRGS